MSADLELMLPDTTQMFISILGAVEASIPKVDNDDDKIIMQELVDRMNEYRENYDISQPYRKLYRLWEELRDYSGKIKDNYYNRLIGNMFEFARMDMDNYSVSNAVSQAYLDVE